MSRRKYNAPIGAKPAGSTVPGFITIQNKALDAWYYANREQERPPVKEAKPHPNCASEERKAQIADCIRKGWVTARIKKELGVSTSLIDKVQGEMYMGKYRAPAPQSEPSSDGSP